MTRIAAVVLLLLWSLDWNPTPTVWAVLAFGLFIGRATECHLAQEAADWEHRCRMRRPDAEMRLLGEPLDREDDNGL